MPCVCMNGKTGLPHKKVNHKQVPWIPCHTHDQVAQGPLRIVPDVFAQNQEGIHRFPGFLRLQQIGPGDKRTVMGKFIKDKAA